MAAMTTALSLLALAFAAASCGGTLDVPGDAPPSPPDPTRFGPPEGEGFPCDVRQVLVTYCADCHAGQTYTPAFLTPEIVRVQVLSDGTTFGDQMVVRMRDTMTPMPPRTEGLRPTEADVATIAAWVGAGMPTGNCGPLRPADLPH
jgi:hypothetical protein